MAISNREFAAANARGRKLKQTTPQVVAAHYDPTRQQIVLQLSSGPEFEFAFAPHDAQGLETARTEDLDEIEISPNGFGIHFPKLNADFYVPALLEGFLGSKSWAAARFGEAGGKARTEAKQTASRANGRLGGRPQKAVVTKPDQARETLVPIARNAGHGLSKRHQKSPKRTLHHTRESGSP